MDDPELDRIRQERLAQLQSQYKQPGEAQQNAKAQEEQVKAQEDMKNSILSQVMDQFARARLNTLKLGKPEKGQVIESMIIQMARSGQIRNKITEQELIGLLENVNTQFRTTETKVKFDRRRAALDSDDEDF